MGRIFDWQTIAERRIPNHADFEDARSRILKVSRQYLEQDFISSAVIVGSVSRGEPTIRSDLDLVLIANDPGVLPLLGNKFNEVTGYTKVPIEAKIVFKPFIAQQFHNLSPSMLRSVEMALTNNRDNLVGGNPLSFIRDNIQWDTSHLLEIRSKAQRITEGAISGDLAIRYRTLQRAFEAPIDIGRATLLLLEHFGALDAGTSIQARSDVVHWHRNVTNNSPFDKILELDSKIYDPLLQDAINGGCCEKEYYNAIEGLLREAIPQSLKFLEVEYNFVKEKLYSRSIEGQVKATTPEL